MLDEAGLRELLRGVELELGDAHAETAMERAGRKEAERIARAAAWWRDNAPWVIVGVTLVSFGAGIAIGAAVEK